MRSQSNLSTELLKAVAQHSECFSPLVAPFDWSKQLEQQQLSDFPKALVLWQTLWFPDEPRWFWFDMKLASENAQNVTLRG